MPRLTVTRTETAIVEFTPEPGYSPTQVVGLLQRQEAYLLGDCVVLNHVPAGGSRVIARTTAVSRPGEKPTYVLNES